MNIVLVVNKDISESIIEGKINEIDCGSHQLILKLIDGNDLSFFSFTKTFSNESINKIKLLNFNKKIIYNFDIYNEEQYELMKQSELENIFLDIYVNDVESINKFNEITPGIRKDLNIINKEIHIDKHYFDNIDSYYEDDVIKNVNFELEIEMMEFNDYLNNFYNSTLIYYLNSNYDWNLYLFSKNRFFKTERIVNYINVNDDFLWIKRYIKQKSIKSKNCLTCENKVSCIKQDLFIYFNQLEKCSIKDNYVK